MGVFKPDLFRAFGIGFAIGTLGVCLMVSGVSTSGLAGSLVPAAIAAPAR